MEINKIINVTTVGELIEQLNNFSKETQIGWIASNMITPVNNVCIRTGNFISVEQTFTDAFDYTEYSKTVYKREEKLSDESGKETGEFQENYSRYVTCLEINRYYDEEDEGTKVSSIQELLDVLLNLDDKMQIITPDYNFEIKGFLTKGLYSWIGKNGNDEDIYVIEIA